MYEADLDQQTDLSEQVLYVRQQFQDIIGDTQEEPFCITEEEAEQCLGKADAYTCVRVMHNLAKWLHDEEHRGNRYMADEIVAFLERDVATPKVKPSTPEPPKQAKHYKKPGNYAGNGKADAMLAVELSKRIKGYTFSTAETQGFINAAKNGVHLVLQSGRNLGKYTQVRRNPLSHVEVVQSMYSYIQKEIAKEEQIKARKK